MLGINNPLIVKIAVACFVTPNAGHNRAPAREARREPNSERSDAVRRSGSCPCWAAHAGSERFDEEAILNVLALKDIGCWSKFGVATTRIESQRPSVADPRGEPSVLRSLSGSKSLGSG